MAYSTNCFGGNAVKYRFWTAWLFNPACKINNVATASVAYRSWIITSQRNCLLEFALLY